MARPKSFKKWFQGILDSLSGNSDSNESSRQGRAPIGVGKYKGAVSSYRIRAEQPTQNIERFRFIMDVLSSSPAIHSAFRKLAEDAALDENGDDWAWSLGVKVEIDTDGEESGKDALRKTARDLRRQLQIIFENYVRRTRIGYNTKHYIYKYLTAGNCYAEQEIEFDTQTGLGKIANIKELPTFQIKVETDDFAEVTAYEQYRTAGDTKPIRWEIPAQIIHWKYHACDYLPEGDTAMSSFRVRWEGFKLLELDLLAAIHTHSVNPVVFKLMTQELGKPVSRERIKEFEAELKDNPTDINRLYVVAEGDVELEFPKTDDASSISALLSAHRDFESRFVEALGVPGILAGNAKDVAGRHIASSMTADYARRVASIRGDFSFYIYPSIALEFALNGFDLDNPEKYGVKNISVYINWPDLGESRTQKSKRTLMEWVAGAMPLEEKLRQDGNQDPESTIQMIEEERKRGILPLQFHFQMPSNNEEQGRGVSNPGNEDENQNRDPANLDPAAASAFGKMLQQYLNGDEQIRQIVREELEKINAT